LQQFYISNAPGIVQLLQNADVGSMQYHKSQEFQWGYTGFTSAFHYYSK